MARGAIVLCETCGPPFLTPRPDTAGRPHDGQTRAVEATGTTRAFSHHINVETGRFAPSSGWEMWITHLREFRYTGRQCGEGWYRV